MANLPTYFLVPGSGPTQPTYTKLMKIRVIVHEAEEGGYWAEVPAIPGCATQGESFEELLHKLYEAVEACLSVDMEPADESAALFAPV
jgi:predicted RNase H-like HicB family nuclease